MPEQNKHIYIVYTSKRLKPTETVMQDDETRKATDIRTVPYSYRSELLYAREYEYEFVKSGERTVRGWDGGGRGSEQLVRDVDAPVGFRVFHMPTSES